MQGRFTFAAASISLSTNSMVNRYYEGGVSSVYFWDLDDGFAGVVLLKKSEITLKFS